MGRAAISRYLNTYPRTGDCAIVCEGDFVGYEAALIVKWFLNNNLHIDVWPCGMASAAPGVVDAIGRSIPVFVIEDRDFRELSQANQGCEKKKDDRVQRGARIINWVSWQRHEIENYLLEPDVIFPVMGEAFKIKNLDLIQQKLERLLKNSFSYYALQCAIYQWRSNFPRFDPTIQNISGKFQEPKPFWDSVKKTFVFPSQEQISNFLNKVADANKEIIENADKRLLAPKDCENIFNSKIKQWENMEVGNKGWLIDWPGKDVMAHLRKELAYEFSWQEENINWDKMSRAEQKERDLEIEQALQPYLCNQFLRFLSQQSNSAIRKEWDGLVESVKNFKKP
ncbi:MAG: hypothetical protein HY747_09240 [Elusimicrobia bacterium]|nr:hypothetical protein [Elusimicrobiota bacterium]